MGNLTGNFSEPTGDTLLGPAVLIATFGTCKQERKSLCTHSHLSELREFLWNLKQLGVTNYSSVCVKENWIILYLFWNFIHQNGVRVSRRNPLPCTGMDKSLCRSSLPAQRYWAPAQTALWYILWGYSSLEGSRSFLQTSSILLCITFSSTRKLL